MTKPIGVLALALTAFGAVEMPAFADDLNIVFTVHSSPANTFWHTVKTGYDDACQKVNANCQMIFTQNEGSIDQEIANIQAAIATKPYALITTIVDNKAFDQVISDARKAGIVVIATNVDDTEGAAGNERQAFIGQGFINAGYARAQATAPQFPASGPIHVLIGVNAPGQNWSEQRAAGVQKYLDEYKAAHKDRDISWERVDAGADFATVADHVGAKLAGDNTINVYFDTGANDSAIARVLRDRGIAAGQVILAGFDLIPEVLAEMKTGYVKVQVDQQPYEQGFMPVMEIYLNKVAGLAPADIDTGRGVVTPDMVDKIEALSAAGLR
jgi:simple sugar transport system substrate-binding protein